MMELASHNHGLLLSFMLCNVEDGVIAKSVERQHKPSFYNAVP